MIGGAYDSGRAGLKRNIRNGTVGIVIKEKRIDKLKIIVENFGEFVVNMFSIKR